MNQKHQGPQGWWPLTGAIVGAVVYCPFAFLVFLIQLHLPRRGWVEPQGWFVLFGIFLLFGIGLAGLMEMEYRKDVRRGD